MNPFRRILKLFRRRAADSWWSGVQGWGALVPGSLASLSGVGVDANSALSLTAYYAAINRISTDLASLPLRVYRRLDDGSRIEDRAHPVWDLLATSPDDETTSMRWRQALMGHVLGWGNGYAEITFAGGRPYRLYLLDPNQTKCERDLATKRIAYRSKGQMIDKDAIIHVAGFGFDGLCGYSPAYLAREAIGLGLAAEQFGSAFFGNGSRPGGIIEVPHQLKAGDAKALRESWQQLHSGPSNAGRPAVLQGGAKFTPLMIPPEDAQFLETRKFQVLEIARLFGGLPPHKIGDYSQSHLANIEASNLDYLSTTIMPWAEQVEQEFRRKLFTPEERRAGYYVEHNLAAFLRGDSKARAEYYRSLRDLGAISPNEIRRLENMNPIDDGDVYLVQAQMVPLAMAGAAFEAKAKASAVSTDVEDDVEDDDRASRNGRLQHA